MVLVNCRWEQEDIINVIEKIEIEGFSIFKHIKTEGMKIFFDSKIKEKNEKATFIDEYNLIKKAIMNVHRTDTFAISIIPIINDSVVEGYKYSMGGVNYSDV